MGIRIRKLYNSWPKKLIIVTVVLVAISVGFYFKFASAAFLGNSGNLSWGDTTAGRVRVDTYTFGSPGTFGTSFRPSTAPSASPIEFVVNKAAPTRNEKLIGTQLANGRMYIASCTTTCSATANINSNLWFATILGTNVVTRAYDIAYEQASGRAMVVYAGNQTGYLFYCIYDGTSWGPVSTCAPTVGSNSIALDDGTTALTGTPAWVRLVANGEQFGTNRTNKMLLAVQDTNNDVYTTSWDGTAWSTTDDQTLTTTGGATVATTGSGTQSPPAFDVGYESNSGTEMAVYADGTALTYRTSTGSGWSSASSILTLASAAQWIRLASDPMSNRMSLITAFGSTGTVGSTATATPWIWKTDGSTAGFTAYTSLTMAQDAGQNISTAWLKANTGTPKAMFTASANANTSQPDAGSWTQGGGFVAWAALTTTTTDILVNHELVPSPNSDIIAQTQTNRDGRMGVRTYSGSAWSSLITTNLPTTTVNTTAGNSSNQTFIQKSHQYSYRPYSTWSLNWRIYSDYATAGNPTTALANESTTATLQPTGIVRLRMNFAELSGGTIGDTRKKLQYSSGAGCPDSTTCTWTDVGANGSGSIWRYSTSGGLSDNSTVASTLLDGSTANGYSVTNGTATATSGAAQTANSVQEYDYTLQNNGAANNTTYYFRAYDFGPSVSGGSMTNLNPILRKSTLNTAGVEQDNCTDGSTPQACTYPSIYSNTGAPNPPTFYFPTNGSSNSSSTPTIQLKAADILSNYLQYVIEWCPTNGWPCAAGGGSFDQTASQTNWTGQDAGSGTAYIGLPNEANSTMGLYTVSPGLFSPSTTYYLRAKAYDPGGTATYGAYSSTIGFTTSNLNVLIQGGTTITGGTIIAN
jgi:hypothetical protein